MVNADQDIQYAEEQYHLDVTGNNLFQLNRAITSGAENNIFALPKGPSGKVKLAPKASATKEVCCLVFHLCAF